MTPKIEDFLRRTRPETPCLVVDLDVVAENYRRLRAALPQAEIYYAVKANPASPVIATLSNLGSKFDVASLSEIDRCLAAGADPQHLAYGSTAKKRSEIATAYARGVRMFALDSASELEKIAEAAPGSKVFCRILVENKGALWPLGEKFGCAVEFAVDLMVAAKRKGLVPYGISFHVGSQQIDLTQWDIAIGQAALVFTALREKGIELSALNLGGGLPTRYRDDVPDEAAVAAAIMAAVAKHFGNRAPTMMLEPGRFVVANAGLVRSEVILVTTKRPDDETRWVYLDVGRFGGLAETEGEMIQYELRTKYKNPETGPVIVAGPTCDGVDILYRKSGYRLPMDLACGDYVDVLSAGAYTASYASIGFNGFPPLKEYYL
ncbi:MAG: ornithine decarboxylase [Rhodospirillales bacterium]|nr:ornithine decarboxylase [Rhodospirillales bacterium]